MKPNELKTEEQGEINGGSVLSGLPLLGGSSNNDDSTSSSGHSGGDDNSSGEGSSGLPIIGDLLGDSII